MKSESDFLAEAKYQVDPMRITELEKNIRDKANIYSGTTFFSIIIGGTLLSIGGYAHLQKPVVEPQTPKVYEIQQNIGQVQNAFNSICSEAVQTNECGDLEIILNNWEKKLSSPQAQQELSHYEAQKKEKRKQDLLFASPGGIIPALLLLGMGAGRFVSRKTYKDASNDPQKYLNN